MLITRLKDDLRSLPRQYWALVAGTLVYLIGVEMCYPYETLFLNGRLGISMTTIGVVLGVTLFATLPMQVVGGALCDRIGRRPMLIVAVCGSITLYIGFALARQFWLLVALITFEAAFGWAQYVTASNAMIADLTPLERRADAFSISRVALNIGVTIGPLFAIPLIARDPSYRLTFLCAAAVCGLFLLMAVFSIKESRPATVERVSIAEVFRGYAEVLRDRRMVVFCLVALLPLYGFGQIWVTMPIMLESLQDVSAQMWSVVLVVYGAATAVLQYPVIKWLERRDHMLLLSLSCVCTAVGMAASAYVPWPGTLVCILAISFGIVLLLPITSTVVSNFAPVALRGRYMGMWTLVYMGGYAIGPLLGGWALDELGGHGAFLVIAAADAIGAFLFVMLRDRGPHEGGEARREAVEALADELRGERPEQAL